MIDDNTFGIQKLIGKSKKITELKNTIEKIAPINIPVLLTGEVGTGKTLIAKTIHEMSGRVGPFVSINLSSLSVELASAELFGYEKGAFTGANNRKTGLLEAADKGTLFIDELASAPPQLQNLLIRFITDSTFSPVGSTKSYSVDVRIISSFLGDYRKAGMLRKDLLFRLSGIVIEVPPLRERKEDIPELINIFLKNNDDIKISPQAVEYLKNYDFPGNIRELLLILERAKVLSNSKFIDVVSLRIPDYTKRPSEPEEVDDYRRELTIVKAELMEFKRNSIIANPIWEGRKFSTEFDYCFVLMPFSESKDIQKVYNNHVKPIIEKRSHLRCERADDIHDISGVMQSVWESINRARIIIAEMTERNPNVFYELGIAHTLGKPVIMITQSMDYVPFDLKHLRCIVYQFKPDTIEKFERSLEKTVQRVLASTYASPSTKIIQE